MLLGALSFVASAADRGVAQATFEPSSMRVQPRDLGEFSKQGDWYLVDLSVWVGVDARFGARNMDLDESCLACIKS